MLNLAIGGLAFLTTISTAVKAGPLCPAACYAAAAAYPPLVPAIPSCLAACSFACLSNGTIIMVTENGRNTSKYIQDVKSGDIVLTIKDEQPHWTKVQNNIKSEGNFDFIKITAQALNNTTNIKHLEVTPEHGLIFYHDNAPMTIKAARNIKIEDKLIDSNNNKLVVTEINQAVLNEKYTLETSEGTVLASDVFMTTLCKEEVTAGESLLGQTITDWQSRHSFDHVDDLG